MIKIVCNLVTFCRLKHAFKGPILLNLHSEEIFGSGPKIRQQITLITPIYLYINRITIPF